MEVQPIKDLYSGYDDRIFEHARLSVSMGIQDWLKLPDNVKNEVIWDYTSERLASAEHALRVMGCHKQSQHFKNYPEEK